MKKILLLLFSLVVITASAQAPEDVEVVEIGGVYWSNINIGATTVATSPSSCFGDYFAWSEIEPRYTSIEIQGTFSATFGGWKDEHSEGYSYDDQPPYDEYSLDEDHDAATQIWGREWKTPSRGDFQDLTSACGGWNSGDNIRRLGTANPEGGIYWIPSSQTLLPQYNGVAGILFVDKEDTNKRLFFPAAGYINNTDFRHTLSDAWTGGYWSSSVYSSNPSARSYMSFIYTFNGNVTKLYSSEASSRNAGRPIRPVLKEAPSSIETISYKYTKTFKRIKDGRLEIINGRHIYNSVGHIIK